MVLHCNDNVLGWAVGVVSSVCRKGSESDLSGHCVTLAHSVQLVARVRAVLRGDVASLSSHCVAPEACSESYLHLRADIFVMPKLVNRLCIGDARSVQSLWSDASSERSYCGVKGWPVLK